MRSNHCFEQIHSIPCRQIIFSRKIDAIIFYMHIIHQLSVGKSRKSAVIYWKVVSFSDLVKKFIIIRKRVIFPKIYELFVLIFEFLIIFFQVISKLQHMFVFVLPLLLLLLLLLLFSLIRFQTKILNVVNI